MKKLFVAFALMTALLYMCSCVGRTPSYGDMEKDDPDYEVTTRESGKKKGR